TQRTQAKYAVFFLQVLLNFGAHGFGIWKLCPLHLQHPDVARVINTAVDLTAAQRLELNGLAHRFVLIDGKTGAAQLMGQELREDVLLGERTTADRHRICGRNEKARKGLEEPGHQKEDQAGSAEYSFRTAPVSCGDFEEADELIQDHSQRGGGDAAEQRRHMI